MLKYRLSIFSGLIILFFSSQVYSQSCEAKNVFNSIVVNKDSLEIFYKRSDIPRAMKKSLKEKFGDFSIANPDEGFRKNDVERDIKKSRQMVFLAKYNNNYALVFWQGGRALTQYVVFSEIQHDKMISLKLFYVKGDITVAEDLLYKNFEDFNEAKW